MRSPHIHSPTGDNDNQTHHSLSTSYVPPPPGSLQDSYFHLTEEHTGSERLRTFPRPHPKPEAFLVFLVGQEVLEGKGCLEEVALGLHLEANYCSPPAYSLSPMPSHNHPTWSPQEPLTNTQNHSFSGWKALGGQLTLFLSHLPVTKLRPREGHDIPKLTQPGMESQDGSPGLLTPGSGLSPVQVAHARFSRALSPLSGVELVRVTHTHALLWLNLLPGCAGLTAEC